MNKYFKKMDSERKKIVKQQQKEIKKIYKESSKEIKKEIKKLKDKNDVSSVIRKRELKLLSEEINSYIKNADAKTKSVIEKNVDLMVSKVLENNQLFITDLGFNFYSNTPEIKNRVVKTIMFGDMYNGKWTLSKAIWDDDELKIKEIKRIISKGILKNKGVYDIAKDIERYVNPDSKNKKLWGKDFPGVRKKIDYNSQRLARTMVSHAYEESFIRSTINNPFIDAYRWITSGGHNTCALCLDREYSDRYGLGPGIFPKDKLPLDHPNGMCTFDVVITMSDDEISQAIYDWYSGVGDLSMNKKIDKFINDLKSF